MDKDTLLKVLDRPVAFHRCFVPVAESVAGAVWLSQLVYWSGRGQDSEGWIYKTQLEWKEETGLGRSEQETVRQRLRNKGVLEEKSQGIPCRLFYRLNLEKLSQLISSKAHADSDTSKDAENKHTEMTESCKQVGVKSADKGEEIRPTITENLHRLQNKPPHVLEVGVDNARPLSGSSDGDIENDLIIEPSIALYFPQLLLVLQQVGITDTVYAQDLLDELAGTLEAINRGERKKIGKAATWLRSIALNGNFERARCYAVQARRRATKANEEFMSSISELEVDPESQAKGAEMLAGLRKRCAT